MLRGCPLLPPLAMRRRLLLLVPRLSLLLPDQGHQARLGPVHGEMSIFGRWRWKGFGLLLILWGRLVTGRRLLWSIDRRRASVHGPGLGWRTFEFKPAGFCSLALAPPVTDGGRGGLLGLGLGGLSRRLHDLYVLHRSVYGGRDPSDLDGPLPVRNRPILQHLLYPSERSRRGLVME